MTVLDGASNTGTLCWGGGGGGGGGGVGGGATKYGHIKVFMYSSDYVIGNEARIRRRSSLIPSFGGNKKMSIYYMSKAIKTYAYVYAMSLAGIIMYVRRLYGQVGLVGCRDLVIVAYSRAYFSN